MNPTEASVFISVGVYIIIVTVTVVVVFLGVDGPLLLQSNNSKKNVTSGAWNVIPVIVFERSTSQSTGLNVL